MTVKNTGRATGLVLLVQLVGLVLPFVLLLPLGRDFITSAAPAAVQIRLAVILLFANGGLTIWLSLLVARALRAERDSGAIWLVAAGVAMGVLQAVDNAFILALLAVSERSVSAVAAAEAHVVSGEAIRLIRQWTHTVAILAIDFWIVSLYACLPWCAWGWPNACTTLASSRSVPARMSHGLDRKPQRVDADLGFDVGQADVGDKELRGSRTVRKTRLF